MKSLSKKEKMIVGFSIALSCSSFFFQNCSQKFQSQVLQQSSSTNSAGSAAPIDQAPPDENSKMLDCPIPSERVSTLSSTCLPKALERISRIGALENFVEYEPQYPLYADGAVKRRWIYIPDGSRINSMNPDHWKFPMGTILFKEFKVAGKIIETRMIEKISEGDGFRAWRFSIFANRKDNSDSDRLDNNDLPSQTDLMQNYMASTVTSTYKIGSLNQCLTCHSGSSDVARGFNYLQLSSRSKPVNLDYIVNLGLLTNIPFRFDEIPGTSLHQQALGYLQSNCVTCHDGASSGPGDFRHLSTSNSFSDEPLFQTMFGSPTLIVAGQAGQSKLFDRFSTGNMPKIQPVTKDEAAITLIEEWINQMQ
jgi:hypothetical protein